MAVQSAAAIPLTTLQVQPFRFKDLPTELRLKLYEYVLSSPYDVTLRSRNDLEVRRNRYGERVRPSASPKIRNINILMTSKKIFTEAIPIFYNLNQFHYSILRTVPSVQGVLSHFMLHLHLMQHVSIDYMLSTYACHISEVDRLVSTRVKSINDGCPRLRTFTLHLLTFYKNEDLNRNLPSNSQTAFELSRMAARYQDRTCRLEDISIVTHGNLLALLALQNGVGVWVDSVRMEWPGISIDDYQKEGIRRRESGDPDQEIREYHLVPVRRKRARD